MYVCVCVCVCVFLFADTLIVYTLLVEENTLIAKYLIVLQGMLLR